MRSSSGWAGVEKMAESGADGAPGKGLIRVTVKTPKDKEEIEIGETVCVKEVRKEEAAGHG